MPTPALDSFAKQSGQSIKEVERLWDKSKIIAAEKFKDGTDEFYSYTTGILKKMLKLEGKDFSRSLYVSKDIKEGELITQFNIKSVRPGYSLHPKYFPEILGKKAIRNLCVGDRIQLTDFE